MKKMMVKVHQKEKNQTAKNQTEKNQMTKKMMKKNLKVRKEKNQKAQHQLVKLASGKNARNSWELGEELLNALVIHVSSRAMMALMLLMDHPRPNVLKVKMDPSHGPKTLVTAA